MKKDRIINLSMAAAVIGLLDSLYLTWIKIGHKEALCAGIGDCDTVNASSFSEIGGIPIAVFGAGAYVALLFLFWLEKNKEEHRENAVMLGFGIILIGVLYSAYLTYVEVAILHAICPYCVLSAIMLVLLFIMSIIRLKDQLA
ncbi:MAG: vitamin K epoxide reductase family protein [Anaerolineae bacterium]|nr:vitamin K epoxide reductase family protein [Anaerolineae bacterium]